MSKHSSGVQRDEKEREIESEERQGGKRDSARVHETTSDPGVAVGGEGREEGGERGVGERVEWGEQKSFWKRRKGKKFACTELANTRGVVDTVRSPWRLRSSQADVDLPSERHVLTEGTVIALRYRDSRSSLANTVQKHLFSFPRSLLGLPSTSYPKSVTVSENCEYVPNPITFPTCAFVYVS
uniref:Uncharacterized protein n=1 Tax=Vespula pensylvanica TaxID=30213 RepID=A0A834P2T2_VESPE|nr:hypothetical protein H0235_008100 [Vespula pensylvanica]